MASAKIFRINYKSDFILTLESDAGWMTPFCIKFWTGAPSQAYYVSWDGETYDHCSFDPSEPTKLTVQFDDHHLPIGGLKFQIAYHFTVADFPNDTEDEVLNQANITTEIDGETYQVMLDFTGETAPEIQFSLPAYANEAQRIANEQQRITNEEQRIAAETVRIQNEQQRIAQEQIRQQNEQQRINQEQARVNEYAGLKADAVAATGAANDAAAQANQKAQLAADKAALAESAATLANQKAQLAADKAALANSAATLANQKAALAQQKAEYAQTQGDYAKTQGDYAKEQGDTALADHQRAEVDHGIAVDDHTQAGNDHTRAESDNGIAADDHTQAGNDHTRAESDHSIAVDDNTQAGNDHTRAESDHRIAADDHTQAGNDHTRAESDHTRAESDHAAVEVFVDSLGVFDLSKYNAVGGVLATYADLSAALTALNALDSKYKYGGMSFKFIRTYDNKYVQFRCMAQNFTTDVNQWQGVDNEAISDNPNLITSGGTINAIIPLESQLKKQVVLTNTVLAGGYINNSGGITTNASFSIKYAQVQKGDLVYIKTKVSRNYGGFALFSNTPTLQSVPIRTIAKTDIFYKVPQDCYIGVSNEGSHMDEVGIFLYQYNEGRTICELLNDTFIEADVLYKGICVFKNASQYLNGYINSDGTNAVTSDTWKILYAYVTKGTVINSNGSKSGNYRAGFTDMEPVSGFTLDTIIDTSTTFPYVAERSGYFCISSGNPSSLYLETKNAAPEIAGEDEINEIREDIFILNKKLIPIHTYNNYYVRANDGSWIQLNGTGVYCYEIEPDSIYYINSSVNTNYSLVGWCINEPSQGTVPDVNIPYTNNISRYQKAPHNAHYMLISGNLATIELYSYLANKPHNNVTLNTLIQDKASQNRIKKALYVGDSISTGYNWREFLKEDYSLKFEANKSAMPASVGGITLRPKQNEVADNESIWWRCAEHRLLNAGYTPTIISVMGGTNDMSNTSLSIGTAQDIPFVDNSDDFTVETYDASDGWPDTITLCSALKGCILMLKRDYPNAQIIIPTVLYCSGRGTWIPSGQTLMASEVISKMQVKVAQVMGVRFVPWYWSERKESTIDIFAIDGVHPSIAGARVMERWFADYMPL